MLEENLNIATALSLSVNERMTRVIYVAEAIAKWSEDLDQPGGDHVRVFAQIIVEAARRAEGELERLDQALSETAKLCVREA